MKSELKHRLIGVLVFCAIAAAFLPVLFHHPHPEIQARAAAAGVNTSASDDSNGNQQIQVQLPQQASAPVKIVNPVQAAQQTPEVSEKLLKTAKVAPQAPPKASSKDVVQTAAEQALSLSSDIPTAWVIKLGTFKAADNAKNLLSKLRASGLTAYTREVKQQGRSFVRVYVGPQISRHQTEVLQQKLQTEFGVSGVIAKYDLNEDNKSVS